MSFGFRNGHYFFGELPKFLIRAEYVFWVWFHSLNFSNGKCSAGMYACLIPYHQVSVLTEACKKSNGNGKNNHADPDENAKGATDGDMV